MKYTDEQQSIAIHNACRRLGLDSHVTIIGCKSNLVTYADKALSWLFRKGMPCKKSYMFCDTLDMTFCFTKDGEAVYSHSGYVDNRDLDRILKAFETANNLVKYMEEEIHKFDDERGGNKIK